jgi:hypothetical protein
MADDPEASRSQCVYRFVIFRADMTEILSTFGGEFSADQLFEALVDSVTAGTRIACASTLHAHGRRW